MRTMTLDAEAGHVSEELARHGIPPHVRVRVRVEVVEDDAPPMAVLARTGGAFDWLAEEPDIYTDADLIERQG